MRMQICGYEVITGNAKATGKPYDMSRIHTLIPLAASDNAAGVVGTSYDAPAHVLDKLRGWRSIWSTRSRVLSRSTNIQSIVAWPWIIDALLKYK